MLRLPRVIEARLVDSRGSPLEAADVLVGVNLLADGRYYYGNLIGLTDVSGVTRLQREELELRFASDRVLYPADYRIELAACDPPLEIVLLSESDLEDAVVAISKSHDVSPDIRDAYARATNRAVRPALVRVWGDLPGESTLTVALPTFPEGSVGGR